MAITAFRAKINCPRGDDAQFVIRLPFDQMHKGVEVMVIDEIEIDDALQDDVIIIYQEPGGEVILVDSLWDDVLPDYEEETIIIYDD